MTSPAPPKGGGKAWVAAAATFGATFGMNYLSLHGVDFSVWGISSEIVKSSIEAGLLLFLTWLTPDHLVDSVVRSILWVRMSARRIWRALTSPIPDMQKKED